MKPIHLHNIKNSKNIARGRAFVHQIARDPYVDWAIIFSISLAVAVALASIGVFSYIHLDQQLSSSDGSRSVAAGNAIDTKSLAKVLQQIDGKAAERTDLEHGYSGPTDPSQ